MSRISNKIKKVRLYAGVKFTQGKMFVPVDCHLPTTAKEGLGRQLLEAGLIKRDEFDRMLGVTFDMDTDTDKEVFDDEAFSTRQEFEQSSFAEYEDFEDIEAPEPPKPNDVQPNQAAVPVPDNPEPSNNPEPNGEVK